MSHDFEPTKEEKAMLEDMDLDKFMTPPKTPAKPRVHISDNACISCEG